MRIHVTHSTHYQFSQPVFLEPHTFRFCPRNDGAQLLKSFALRVEPEPMSCARSLDLEGNVVVEAAFTGLVPALRLDASMEVETLRTNPFDFVIPLSALQLPLVYDDELGASLVPYRRRQEDSEQVRQFAEATSAATGGRTVEFLPHLNQRLHAMTEKVIRGEGAPQAPSETLRQRRGACRDLAVLFVESCRLMGLAARFVSGYFAVDEAPAEHCLHAWAEVYLPGGGWRGFDPTHGLAVADRHVTTAAGATPPRAAPVAGSFRGTGATVAMSATIQISATGQNGQSQSQV